MVDVMAAVFGDFINPGELEIARTISDDDDAIDGAIYQGVAANYSIDLLPTGLFQVTDNRLLPFNVRADKAGNEGRDLVRKMPPEI